ncbi:MAG: type II toxin-antitoxin system Phd/YefM family antitoxin [Bauldia sp.]
MRKLQASDAKAHFTQLLDDVEGGETVVITRHGKPVARLMPERTGRDDEVEQAMAAIEAIRKRAKPATRKEIRDWINEGRE